MVEDVVQTQLPHNTGHCDLMLVPTSFSIRHHEALKPEQAAGSRLPLHTGSVLEVLVDELVRVLVVVLDVLNEDVDVDVAVDADEDVDSDDEVVVEVDVVVLV